MATKYSGTGKNSPIAIVNKKPSTKRKPTNNRNRKRNKKSASVWLRLLWTIGVMIVLAVGIWFGITFQEGLKYFFSADRKSTDEKSFFDFRTVEVLERHNEKIIGFDVSQYQGVIDWSVVDSVANHSALEFVFIRATMGVDGKDKAFKLNWKEARANHFMRGAYHYYRPDENSLKQAENFIQTVKLSEGDFPPVLDIEERPKGQSMEDLRLGLKRWIDTVEKHYGVKPILYSGENYYINHLEKWFPDHVIWIANYNFFVEEIKPEWHFWQFTEKGVVKGIDGKVDLNIFNGSKSDIRALLIK